MQVKGSLLIYVVKALRGDPSGKLEARVAAEDRPLLAERITPNRWYPFATYKRLFSLLIDAYSGGSMTTVRKWGRDSAEEIIGEVYRSAIQPGHPFRTLKNTEIRFGSFYDFGTLTVEPEGDTGARVSISGFDAGWEAIHHFIAGWLERSLELAGASQVRVDLAARSWAGDPATVFHARWS